MITQIDKNGKKKSDWNQLNAMNYSSLKEVNEMIKIIIEEKKRWTFNKQRAEREGESERRKRENELDWHW